MTSTADTDQHPDVSEISDLTEGLLSASRTAEVRNHIAGCALCDDVQTSLEEIRGLLGTLPGSPRMPDDVAGRIDAALAAEALLNSTAPVEVDSVSRETESTDEETAGSKTTADRPAGHPRGATGPSRRPGRRRRRTAVLGAALGAAVVGVSVFLLQSVQTSNNSDSASKMADSSSSAADGSTHTFSEGTLEGRVSALLGDAASKTPGGEKRQPSVDSQVTPEMSSADPSAPRNPLRTPTATVPPCVQQGTGRSTPPLAAEQGIYKGTDAYLVVLPDTTDPSRVQAYVVDAACVDATPPAKGQLLLTHSYPRS